MNPKRNIKIAPSILAADFTRLGDEIRALNSRYVDRLHIDVMDGHFVPNLTIGPPVIAQIRKKTKLPLDVHMMVSNPVETFESYIAAGAWQVIFHIEACGDPDSLIKTIKREGVRAGVSIRPDTAVQSIEGILNAVDSVLVMTVNPGFGGQTLIKSCVTKIRDIRRLLSEKNLHHVEISVDGGVTIENSRLLFETGADVLVAGKAIYGARDYNVAIRKMRKACAPSQR